MTTAMVVNASRIATVNLIDEITVTIDPILATTIGINVIIVVITTAMIDATTIGEFRKTRHPRNVKFDKVLETCFSGAGNSRFSEAWNLRSLEFANVRSSGILMR
jgi:hypothetical protein